MRRLELETTCPLRRQYEEEQRTTQKKKIYKVGIILKISFTFTSIL